MEIHFIKCVRTCVKDLHLQIKYKKKLKKEMKKIKFNNIKLINYDVILIYIYKILSLK